MKILIRSTPHKSQRYPTVGDWNYSGDPPVLTITVSQELPFREWWLVAIHELIEAALCDIAGISAQTVDKFDQTWLHGDMYNLGAEEPGDDPRSPYRRQHCIATGIERILAAEMGVDWQVYSRLISDLD